MPMTAAVQLCSHLRRRGRGVMRTEPGGIIAEVCKSCSRELDARLAEQEKPESPIEHYARNKEVVMENGCTYETQKKPLILCRRICDTGNSMCPKHVQVFAIKERDRVEKAHARDQRRRTAPKKGRR
jgi:hypothetical protein